MTPHLTHPRLQRPEGRRLLSFGQVAAKLGMSKDLFQRKWQDMLSEGFPPPVLGNRRGGRKRWDEKAIDLWLDSQMPAHLQLRLPARIDGPIGAHIDTADLEQRLGARALEMA